MNETNITRNNKDIETSNLFFSKENYDLQRIKSYINSRNFNFIQFLTTSLCCYEDLTMSGTIEDFVDKEEMDYIKKNLNSKLNVIFNDDIADIYNTLVETQHQDYVRLVGNENYKLFSSFEEHIPMYAKTVLKSTFYIYYCWIKENMKKPTMNDVSKLVLAYTIGFNDKLTKIPWTDFIKELHNNCLKDLKELPNNSFNWDKIYILVKDDLKY